MSAGLWILLILVALLTALNLLPVGVDAEYAPEGFFLRIKAGPAKITLLPKQEKKPKKPKKEKKKKEKPEAEPKKEKKKLHLTPDMIFTLVRLGLEAVGSFRRKLRVELFRLWLLVAGSDPYQTAVLYGRIRAALDGLYPLFARAFTIEERDVRVGADFTKEKLQAQGRLILTIRVGQAVLIGLVFAWKFGLWYLKKRIAEKRAKSGAKPAERKDCHDGS